MAMKEITESTLFPLSLVVIIIAAAMWAAEVKSSVEGHDVEILKMQKKEDKYLDYVRVIDERLSHIEGKLGIHARGN